MHKQRLNKKKKSNLKGATMGTAMLLPHCHNTFYLENIRICHSIKTLLDITCGHLDSELKHSYV